MTARIRPELKPFCQFNYFEYPGSDPITRLKATNLCLSWLQGGIFLVYCEIDHTDGSRARLDWDGSGGGGDGQEFLEGSFEYDNGNHLSAHVGVKGKGAECYRLLRANDKRGVQIIGVHREALGYALTGVDFTKQRYRATHKEFEL